MMSRNATSRLRFTPESTFGTDGGPPLLRRRVTSSVPAQDHIAGMDFAEAEQRVAALHIPAANGEEAPVMKGAVLSKTGYALALALRDELVRGGAQDSDFTPQADAIVTLNELIEEHEEANAREVVVDVHHQLRVRI